MQNEVTKRLLNCVEQLKASAIVRSNRQFSLSLNYLPQSWSEIVKGRRDAPVELIRKAIVTYSFNPNYLFLNDGAIFLDDKPSNVQSVVFQNEEDKKIMLDISGENRMKYPMILHKVAELQEIPAIRLPFDYEQDLNLRSFQVVGEGMAPLYQNDDRVIGLFIDPFEWETQLIEGNRYIVVTRSDIHVNSIIPEFSKEKIILTSFDNSYSPQIVSIHDIQEVWSIKYVLKKVDTVPANNGLEPDASGLFPMLMEMMQDGFTDIKEQLADQQEQIAELKESLDSEDSF